MSPKFNGAKIIHKMGAIIFFVDTAFIVFLFYNSFNGRIVRVKCMVIEEAIYKSIMIFIFVFLRLINLAFNYCDDEGFDKRLF